MQKQSTLSLTGNRAGYVPSVCTRLPAPTRPPCDCQNHFVNLNGYKLQKQQTDADKPLNVKQLMCRQIKAPTLSWKKRRRDGWTDVLGTHYITSRLCTVRFILPGNVLTPWQSGWHRLPDIPNVSDASVPCNDTSVSLQNSFAVLQSECVQSRLSCPGQNQTCSLHPFPVR